MKNYWLKLHQDKQRQIWTAEFSQSGVFLLKSRSVKVLDAKYSLGYLGKNNGKVTIIFIDGMANPDKELLNFIGFVKQGGLRLKVYSRLRKYNNLMSRTEIEYYELTGLSCDRLNPHNDDIRFTYNFQNVRRVRVC